MAKFATQSAVETFLYLSVIDGEIDRAEKNFYRDVGRSLDPEHFKDYEKESLRTCKTLVKQRKKAGDSWEALVTQTVDELLSRKPDFRCDQGIGPRLLVWDLLAIANIDGECSKSERELIKHISREHIGGISTVLEMEHLNRAIGMVDSELCDMSSTLFNSEVKNRKKELQKRRAALNEAVSALLGDDDRPEFSRLGDTFKDGSTVSAPEIFGKVGDAVGEAVRVGMCALEESGVGKALSGLAGFIPGKKER